MQKELKQTSKLISLVLRHKPETIGLVLDSNGWANTEELIDKINGSGIPINFETLKVIVDTNDKQRFKFNEDYTKIRANQGHSIEVDLNLKPVTPPSHLFHGTANQFVDSILKSGIKKQNRQYVHLSVQAGTATAVGGRHGKPVILTINTEAMHNNGYLFYVSENNVWLTEEVPPEYISLT